MTPISHLRPLYLSPSTRYAAPNEDLTLGAFDVVKPIADIALQVSKLAEFTGRTEPTVIT